MDVPRGTIIYFKINHYYLIIVSRGTRFTKELNPAIPQTVNKLITPINAVMSDGLKNFLSNL